jgi:hypothetical protein
MDNRERSETAEVEEQLRVKRAQLDRTWGSRHQELLHEIADLEERRTQIFNTAVDMEQFNAAKGELGMLGFVRLTSRLCKPENLPASEVSNPD